VHWYTDLSTNEQILSLQVCDRASQSNGEASTTTDQDGRGWWNGISLQTLWGSHPHCRKRITSLRTVITMLRRLCSSKWLKCIQIWSTWRKNEVLRKCWLLTWSRLACHKLTRVLGRPPKNYRWQRKALIDPGLKSVLINYSVCRSCKLDF